MTAPATSLEDLVGKLPRGGAAYIDRDWLSDSAPPTVASAIVFDPDVGFRWAGGSLCPVSGDDPDTIAWRMFDTLAASVTAAVAGRGPTLVAGQGLIAARVRARLTDLVNGGPPAAVVDTTGQAAGVAAACAAAADLGTVVLATTPLSSTLAYDLYVEVHRRGLLIVGVPDPDEIAATENLTNGHTRDLNPPTALKPSEPLDSSSSWFVVRA